VADWDDKLMVHDYPEHGPGKLSIDELYEMFRERMELERHSKDCWLRGKPRGESCDCGLTERTT
jgi:hypothetical protein